MGGFHFLQVSFRNGNCCGNLTCILLVTVVTVPELLHVTLDKLSGFNVRFRLWALLSDVNPSLANFREVTKSNNIAECLKILDIVVKRTVHQWLFLAALLCYGIRTLVLRWSLIICPLTKNGIVHNQGKTKPCVQSASSVSVLSCVIRSSTQGSI